MSGVSRLRLALCCLAALVGWASLSWAQKAAEPAANTKEALARFNSLIGGWKGSGQVKRNSTTGAWRENSEFLWKFDKQTAGIEYRVKDGKHIKSGLLSWNPKTEAFTLSSEFQDGAKREYSGKFEGEALVLESKADAEGYVSRVTLRQLSDIRLLVLYEQRRANQSLYSRVAEVGYTREGAKLASSDQTGPVCIVTGGAGTIKVAHKGETYFVCCTGCKEAFDNDPESFVAEYKAALAKKKAKQN